MAHATLPQVKDKVLTFSIKVVGCVWDGTLKVTSKTTLRDLKLMLVPYAKPITKHELLFLVRGEQTVGLDCDFLNMDHYGVEEGDKIWLYAPFHNATLLVPSMGLSDEFKIRNSHSVLDIKKFVEEKWGVPARNLILYCAGLMMEDSKCLDDYEFCDYLEIYVVVRKVDARKKMVLTTSMYGLGEREICVEECFTGMDIKTVVESASHLPASSQSLFFGDRDSVHSREVYNRDTVLNCGLTPKMELRASSVLGLSTSVIINILLGDQNRWTVYTSLSNTVTKLLNAIREVQPGHEPALFIGDTKLEPHKYLAQYNLKNDSRVTMEWVIRLAVTLPGGHVKGVIIKRGYTIDEVKKLIEKQCDIPCWMQKLSHMDGNKEDLIPDDKTICDCEKLYATGLSGLRWNKKWSFFFPTYPSNNTKPAV